MSATILNYPSLDVHQQLEKLVNSRILAEMEDDNKISAVALVSMVMLCVYAVAGLGFYLFG